MADGSGTPVLEWTHRRYGDLSYRVTAVIDRVRLWRRLPRPVADTCLRFSQYVTVRDGTKIAVDIFRPAKNGVALDGPFPVVWTLERYHRARFETGRRRRLRTCLERELWLRPLCRHGYIVCVADLRGSGASFGDRPQLIMEEDRWDAYDITEWLAAQRWSNGRVGMFGRSFMGMTQYLAASTAPPHLVTIVPEKTLFDLYSFAYSGGVFRNDYARYWGANVTELDRTTAVAAVDADPDGQLRSLAVAGHRDNCDIHQLFSRLPFRDSADGGANALPYLEQSPSRYQSAIGASRVAIYQMAGWYDIWPRDALLWHCNLPNPRKIVLGPWAHTQDGGWKSFAERLRWFDYWLKGIENGVMSEPPIRYYTIGAPRRTAWRSANQWPLPNERPTRLYLATSASSDRRESGLLSAHAPGELEGSDSYTIDYSTTSGLGTRWKNGYGRVFSYPDMAANDFRALTYTTAALTEDLEVTGHPIVSLWLTATAADVDVFVYLEEVRRGGRSEYVTEGVLRASHRAESEPPHGNLRLPYHGSHSEECLPLPMCEPVRLTFDLHPISRVFRRGRRIRVAITGADVDNTLTPAVDAPPVITMYRNLRRPSHIVLPVIPASSGRNA